MDNQIENKKKNPLVSAKNFVAKHRVALAITATAVTCLAVNQRALKQHNEFLKEKGLYDEFYWTPSTPEEAK